MKIPAKIDLLLQQKHFLSASRILMAAEKTINGPDVADVGALENLRCEFQVLKGVCFKLILRIFVVL